MVPLQLALAQPADLSTRNYMIGAPQPPAFDPPTCGSYAAEKLREIAFRAREATGRYEARQSLAAYVKTHAEVPSHCNGFCLPSEIAEGLRLAWYEGHFVDASPRAAAAAQAFATYHGFPFSLNGKTPSQDSTLHVGR